MFRPILSDEPSPSWYVPTDCTKNQHGWLDCTGGEWPTIDQPALVMLSYNDSDVDMLVLEDFEMPHVARLQPVPQPPRLSQLHTLIFRKIAAFRGTVEEGVSVNFPLPQLTALLDKSSVTNIKLDSIRGLHLEENYFAGWPALGDLSIISCAISAIHPRSFAALPPSKMSDGGALATPLNTRLNRLWIFADRTLTVFPWDVLLPIAESINVSFAIPTQYSTVQYVHIL